VPEDDTSSSDSDAAGWDRISLSAAEAAEKGQAQVTTFKQGPRKSLIKIAQIGAHTIPPALASASSTAAPLATRVPFLKLITKHWDSLIMQILFQCWQMIFFYAFITWVPSYLRTSAGVSSVVTQAIILTAYLGCIMGLIAGGWVADRGVPALPFTAGLAVASTALAFGGCAVVLRGSLAAIWAVVVLIVTLIELQPAMIPIVGLSIYPADCRASGFSLAFNIPPILGGLSPLAITAIQLSQPVVSAFGPKSIYALPIWITVGCGATLIGCSLLM
jgi:hypothetical protein